MPTAPEIRASTMEDIDAIVSMYPRAFPDEDLVPVVLELLRAPDVAMSLVATIDAEIIGHVAFTACSVEGCDVNASMLAPLAVVPEHQRQGVGTAIVREGLQRLRDTRVEVVFVLGDPAYYSRHGFITEARVQPPYPLPAEYYSAWQSHSIADVDFAAAGKLAVPSMWLDPALWSA